MNDELLNNVQVSDMTLKEKIGQCFMPAVFINDSEEEITKIENLISSHHIGSICFFHSRASAATNFEGKKKIVHNQQSYDTLLKLIERFQKAAKYPLLIAMDAEWGLAMRIENTPQYPYALTLGAMNNRSDLVFEVGKQIAMDCRIAGVHWNLAPVVDINNNPKNPVIGFRSFGDSKKQVTEYAQAYLEGMKSVGVLNSIKHFPGHGDTAVDSHLGLPKIEKTKEDLLQNELFPFIRLIENGVDSVMVGHLAVPALSQGNSISASLSKEIITDFLRNELKYEGLVISDALNMHSVSKQFIEPGEVEFQAFEAGNDVLCFANDVEKGIEAILQKSSSTRIEESFDRLWKLKMKAFEAEKIEKKKPSTDNLFSMLAKESLTIVKEEEGIFSSFKKEGFQYVSVGRVVNSTFSQKVLSTNEHEKNVLMAIFPPQMRPRNQFGFSLEELETINENLKNNNVILYLFGNPFVLNLFEYNKAKSVVLAYQNFKAFQENAAEHFKGNQGAQGSLSVSLNKTS